MDPMPIMIIDFNSITIPKGNLEANVTEILIVFCPRWNQFCRGL